MNKFIGKIVAFMYGRNGMDKLNTFLMKVYVCLVIVLWILTLLTHPYVYIITSLILGGFAAYIVFRCLSKNIVKRQYENRKFISLCDRINTSISLYKSMYKDRKTHIYKKCPYCKAVLRLKRVKGKHRAACPRCSRSFDVKVR